MNTGVLCWVYSKHSNICDIPQYPEQWVKETNFLTNIKLSTHFFLRLEVALFSSFIDIGLRIVAFCKSRVVNKI